MLFETKTKPIKKIKISHVTDTLVLYADEMECAMSRNNDSQPDCEMEIPPLSMR